MNVLIPSCYARLNQAQVKAALRLYVRTGLLPTRGVTMSKLLEQASKHTGKMYRNRRDSCELAIADLSDLLNYAHVKQQIAETIESGISMTMGDLTPEAAALVRRMCPAGELPLPEGNASE